MDNEEFERFLLEQQIIDNQARWAIAAIVWETHQLEAQNEQMRQALSERQGGSE